MASPPPSKQSSQKLSPKVSLSGVPKSSSVTRASSERKSLTIVDDKPESSKFSQEAIRRLQSTGESSQKLRPSSKASLSGVRKRSSITRDSGEPKSLTIVDNKAQHSTLSQQAARRLQSTGEIRPSSYASSRVLNYQVEEKDSDDGNEDDDKNKPPKESVTRPLWSTSSKEVMLAKESSKNKELDLLKDKKSAVELDDDITAIEKGKSPKVSRSSIDRMIPKESSKSKEMLKVSKSASREVTSKDKQEAATLKNEPEEDDREKTELQLPETDEKESVAPYSEEVPQDDDRPSHKKKHSRKKPQTPSEIKISQEHSAVDTANYKKLIEAFKSTSTIGGTTASSFHTPGSKSLTSDLSTSKQPTFDMSRDSLGISLSEIVQDYYIEEEQQYTASQGYDDNLMFDKSSSETDLSQIDSEESDEPTESSLSGLDTTVVPFSLLWTYGMNTKVPFMNLTESKKHRVFFTSSHEGVLYDYQQKQMTLLQGHQNAITSTSMDIKGKYLVTADSGPENSIIVWRMSICKPVCTIFNANPGSGTAILTMSPNGKYIVSVTSDMPAIIKLWLWSSGSDQPIDTYLTDPRYGKPVGVVFNLTVQERFMVTFKRQIVFMKYHIVHKKFIEPRIPEIRNKSRLGKITDSCYLLENHDCFASTTEGYVMVLGNTYYKTSFNIEEEYDAWKIFITAVKVTYVRLNTINSCDGVVVTGDARGQIKFYDRYVRLLYWCQKFQLPGVHKISFNRDPRKFRFTTASIEPTDPLENKIRIRREVDVNDVSEEYELMYRNMIPSDATLQRAPFVVRDFIVGTDDGNMVLIDYINNECEALLVTAETPVAGVDVHEDMPYLVIAYRNGRISMYDYVTHNMVHSSVLPPMIVEPTPQPGTSATVLPSPPVDEKSSDYLLSKSVTCVKFSPKCYHLAVGRGNGELFFLQPVLLHTKPGYPLRKGTHAIMKLVYSADFKYFAYYDKHRTVYLFYYDVEIDQWLIIGKHRAHTEELTDLQFSPFNPPELYSIGLDKCLVKYDISNSVTDLTIASRKRIDQRAVPNCFLFYPLLDETHFLIADNEFKFKILKPEADLCRHVILGPAYGCYSEAPIKTMSILPNPPNKYLIFATKKHIGIQKLPPDGNPYKYTGTIGHPYKIHQYCVSSCGKYIFTAGRHDSCVLMWQINPEAVENLEKVGGKEIHPFYCLIEGGSEGWLYGEMQNLFYYMQILHQGENSQLPRAVSDRIALSELPDLMRACGFYPTDFEIETMLNDVKFRNEENKRANEEISFRDFIVLYINHRPAHGVSMPKLEKAFTTICEASGGVDEINADALMDMLCTKGEAFSPDALARCVSILMRFNQEQEEEDNGTLTSDLPETINFETFVHDILGIDMNRTGQN